MKVYTVSELATILNLEGKTVVVSGSKAKVEKVSCLEEDVMLTDDNLVVHITYSNGRRNVVRPSEIDNLFDEVSVTVVADLVNYLQGLDQNLPVCVLERESGDFANINLNNASQIYVDEEVNVLFIGDSQ